MKRFWDKVDIKSPNKCWEWKAARSGGRSGKDYGVFRISKPNRRQVYAHRFVFYLKNGYEPNVARHSCHNTLCCNPEHIVDGTQADNVADKVEANRQLKGSQTKQSILKEGDIHQIRLKLSSGMKHKDIAIEYGVCRATISQINRGANWKHVK